MKLQTGVVRLQRRVANFVRQQVQPALSDSTAEVALLGPQADFYQTRRTIAAIFLRGDGIEIGALHQPLPVPASARVKYVDRMNVADLCSQYPELADHPLVEADIIDDGEHLTTIGDRTQDFVIANHFIEHCQNPIQMIQNVFRVLKPEGVFYLAVPDKRFTFDIDRPSTTVEHILRDFSEGPAWSKRQHFEEWSRLVNKRAGEAEAKKEVEHLLAIDYSIHYHVWRADDFLEFVVAVQRLVKFELELFLRNGIENLLILRKT